MGRKKFYESIDEMQKDLEIYLKKYNEKRPHQGRNMNGRTPIEMFKKGLEKNKKRQLESMKKAD